MLEVTASDVYVRAQKQRVFVALSGLVREAGIDVLLFFFIQLSVRFMRTCSELRQKLCL